MKEVKQPSKKPLVYYYLVALLILMVLNLTLFPAMLETPRSRCGLTISSCP